MFVICSDKNLSWSLIYILLIYSHMTTKCPSTQCMDKETVVHIYNGILPRS